MSVSRNLSIARAFYSEAPGGGKPYRPEDGTRCILGSIGRAVGHQDEDLNYIGYSQYEDMPEVVAFAEANGLPVDGFNIGCWNDRTRVIVGDDAVLEAFDRAIEATAPERVAA